MFLFERRMAGDNPQDWSSMYNLIYFSGQEFGRGSIEFEISLDMDGGLEP